MKVSYFENGRYTAPPGMARGWPAPPAAYDPDTGAKAHEQMIDRLRFVEDLGFDWISLSEHHYSPRILTPSVPVAAANIAAQVKRIKIALLGPIVGHSNPVMLAEELAMLDTMAEGRLIVGMLRGTTNEMVTYDLNPSESRARTDEGMELVLKAWTEPQAFGWQGRYFQFRTVSIWPRPLQQPFPPTYSLGTTAEAGDFAARNHVGLGVSFAPYDVMAKATHYYMKRCEDYGWTPTPDQIVYRANMLICETDEEADAEMKRRDGQTPFPVKDVLKDALLAADKRNIAGEAKPANVGGILPTTFIGGPDTIVKQIKQCKEVMGAGVLDLLLQPPASADTDALMSSLELFGKKVLPRIRDI
jgi:alkanesulfonate monooxygenase SsuD/methylene tetrahydromethanopterin reductase-like flavin-dependent oxidoreductase (luciferase family)